MTQNELHHKVNELYKKYKEWTETINNMSQAGVYSTVLKKAPFDLPVRTIMLNEQKVDLDTTALVFAKEDG